MKHLLLTTIAAVVLVGCGPSAPDISFHDAAKKGNIEAVKQHLAAGTDVELKCVECGGTALSHAALRGHKEIVELLISNGSIIKVKGKHGETPLHQAAFAGQREIVELQIDKGADVNWKDKVEATPLHRAAQRGHKEVVELLIEKGAEVNTNDILEQTPFALSIKTRHERSC